MKKKFMAVLVTLTMSFSLLMGCGGSAETDTEASEKTSPSESTEETQQKIAVGFRTGIDMAAAKVLFEELADHYNCEFVYSEVMDDIESELTFIDNAASTGCQAYITWCLNNIEQVASVCADNEMYYVVHSQWDSKWDGSNPYWVGSCGFANPPKGEMYKTMLTEFLTGKDNGGILVTSGLACSGNPQQIETTTATLEAIEDHYGLTFTDGELSELACVDAGTELENDKGVKVYVLPGTSTQDGYNTQLSTLLSTGDYAILAGYTVDANLINIVSEAEEVINQDIIVGGIAVISDSLISIFESEDIFGNCPVNYVGLQYSSVTQSAMFAMAYNALTGYGDIYRDENGNATGYGCGQVTISDPSQGASYAMLDTADNPEGIVATTEWVDTLIAVKNDGYTIENWVENFVNLDCNVLAEDALERMNSN